MNVVAGAFEGMETASLDPGMNDTGVGDRCHLICYSPEDVGGNRDAAKDRAEILAGDMHQCCAHEGTCPLIDMNADEGVEERAAEGP